MKIRVNQPKLKSESNKDVLKINLYDRTNIVELYLDVANAVLEAIGSKLDSRFGQRSGVLAASKFKGTRMEARYKFYDRSDMEAELVFVIDYMNIENIEVMVRPVTGANFDVKITRKQRGKVDISVNSIVDDILTALDM